MGVQVRLLLSNLVRQENGNLWSKLTMVYPDGKKEEVTYVISPDDPYGLAPQLWAMVQDGNYEGEIKELTDNG